MNTSSKFKWSEVPDIQTRISFLKPELEYRPAEGERFMGIFNKLAERWETKAQTIINFAQKYLPTELAAYRAANPMAKKSRVAHPVARKKGSSLDGQVRVVKPASSVALKEFPVSDKGMTIVDVYELINFLHDKNEEYIAIIEAKNAEIAALVKSKEDTKPLLDKASRIWMDFQAGKLPEQQK